MSSSCAQTPGRGHHHQGSSAAASAPRRARHAPRAENPRVTPEMTRHKKTGLYGEEGGGLEPCDLPAAAAGRSARTGRGHGRGRRGSWRRWRAGHWKGGRACPRVRPAILRRSRGRATSRRDGGWVAEWWRRRRTRLPAWFRSRLTDTFEGFTANLERVNKDHSSRMRVKLKSDFFKVIKIGFELVLSCD